MSILDLPGPTFLFVYVIFGFLALLVSDRIRVWARSPKGAPTEETLRSLTPDQMAMLQGGSQGAVVSTVVALVHRGRLVLEQSKLAVASKASQAQLATGVYREVEGLGPETPLERAVVAAVEMGATSVSAIAAQAAGALDALQASLVALGLFTTPELRARREMAIRVPALLLLALGLAKVAVGLSRERPVGFLLLLLLVSSLLLLVRNRDQRSGVGDEAVAILRERHAALAPTAARAPQQLDAKEIALAAALFGAAAFGGPVAAWASPPAAPSGGDGGSSCGGGSCGGGCGGGCGGCGG